MTPSVSRLSTAYRSSRPFIIGLGVLFAIGLAIVATSGNKVKTSFNTIGNTLPADDEGFSASQAPGASGVAVGGEALPTERKIIATASLDVEADNVKAARTKIVGEVTALGGYIANEQSTTGVAVNSQGQPDPNSPPDIVSFYVVAKIPTQRFASALSSIEKIGTVIGRSSGAQDVTAEVVDVDSRVLSARASLDRVRTLYFQAKTIDDITRLETELSRRQGDLEALLAKQNELRGLTSMATITINVARKGFTPLTDGRPSVWAKVSKAFAGTGVAVLVALSSMLPLILLGAPVLVSGWIVHRRRSSRGAPLT